jgi:hypothetical protein
MFKSNDPESQRNEEEKTAQTDLRRVRPLSPPEEAEREVPLAADKALDDQVCEELSHGTPDGAPPDAKSRHESSALFYGLAAVVAVGVIGAMWLVGGSALALATLLIFPAFFLIAVMPVWNAARMRVHDREDVEAEVIRREGVGPRDEAGRPAPKVNPLDA